jgi:hypothetical protein
LTDLYHIGFPKKNQLQVYKNVLQYSWPIIQKEAEAVEKLVDQDEIECYYTNFDAFIKKIPNIDKPEIFYFEKETPRIRKSRIMGEMEKMEKSKLFESMSIKFTKSKIMTPEFKWHVYVKFHSTYLMLRICDSNSKRIDILIPNLIHHTCYFIQHFLQQLVTK